VRAAGGPVIAAGWVPPERKEALLADLDCLVVPSEWRDPAPVVVNEARGRGIPVIGAHRGGIPELIAPVNEPLLFPPGDAAALADRLRAFVADPTAFRPEPEAAPVDWTRHLDLVLAAYADAGAHGP
jgi:glycosyltransferase involved in cell wall biosynthesis